MELGSQSVELMVAGAPVRPCYTVVSKLWVINLFGRDFTVHLSIPPFLVFPQPVHQHSKAKAWTSSCPTSTSPWAPLEVAHDSARKHETQPPWKRPSRGPALEVTDQPSFYGSHLFPSSSMASSLNLRTVCYFRCPASRSPQSDGQ